MNKIKQFLSWNYRAMRHGFVFGRRKTFQLPDRIKMHGKSKLLKLPQGKETMFTEIFLADEYWLQRIANEGIDKIIDVGANIGIFGITARSFFPKASIMCYEPNLMLKEYLDSNADAFELEVFFSAVGCKKGHGRLENKDVNFGHNARFVECEDGDIPIITLSDILKSQGDVIDLVKLDCEGMEYELFKCKEFWSKVRFLTMEYHENEIDVVIQILDSLGFSPIETFEGPFWIGNILAHNRRISRWR